MNMYVHIVYMLLELSLACPHDTHVGQLEVSRPFNMNFATGLKIGFQGAHDATFPKHPRMPHFFFHITDVMWTSSSLVLFE
jgi:hypothetical protein